MAEKPSHSRHPDSSQDVSKRGLLESTVSTDVLYNIRCHDGKNKRIENYTMAENPFEEVTTQDLENAQAPMIIEIKIEAYGIGSPSEWNQAPYGVSNFGKTQGFGDVMEMDDNTVGRRRYTASPSRRDIFTDFTSEVDDEYEEDSYDDERFGLPTRNRTLKESDMTRLSLREVLSQGIFRASLVVWKEIHIYSRNLQKLLQSVIQRYPGQSLKGDKIVVKSPFEMLAHYYNDLNDLRNRTTDIYSTSSRELGDNDDLRQIERRNEVDILDEATLYDLNVLVNTFKLHYVKKFAPEEARHKVGVTSFELLWFLFKPGVDVYARAYGKLAGFVFKSCEKRGGNTDREQYDRNRPIAASSYYVVHCWRIVYDGRRIVKSSHEIIIDKFRGEKPITSLPVFPSSYLDNEDGGKTRARLQEIGERYYNIVRKTPAHMEYCGMCWDFEEIDRREDRADSSLKVKANTEYTGEIVVEYPLSRNYRGIRSRSPPDYDYPPVRVANYSTSRMEDNDSSVEEESDSGDDILREATIAKETKPASFKRINPKEKESLAPHDYFLLTRRMNGYALAKKHKMGFDVENIQPIIWPPRGIDPMSTLILDESDKDVVKALARKYSRGQDTWGADFVEGKGEGQIFLLHGPPGTGKTYTVECVAKYTRRPLLRLTVADIGTNERQMEDILGEWFQRGADWGAIILIDEADVFLEKRQVKDLQRNSLVSVFLSCMEYYTGMLFLTTNRIGQIDDAFLSRTSVALTYRTLDSGQQRHIWQGFLKKLSEERKDIALTDRAKKFLENLDRDETTKDVPWNGREIRNALQTAIALASFDAEEEAQENGLKLGKILVRDTHFQTVVDRRKEFIAYRKSIRNQDEEARAFSEGSRAPPPKKT